MGKTRCPKCQAYNEDGFKLCTECGAKMSIPSTGPMVVLCPGKLDNGSICGAELQQVFKFCQICGTRVDLNLFQSEVEKCQGIADDGTVCGAVVNLNIPFCAHCGKRRSCDPVQVSSGSPGPDQSPRGDQTSEMAKQTEGLPEVMDTDKDKDDTESEEEDKGIQDHAMVTAEKTHTEGSEEKDKDTSLEPGENFDNKPVRPEGAAGAEDEESGSSDDSDDDSEDDFSDSTASTSSKMAEGKQTNTDKPKGKKRQRHLPAKSSDKVKRQKKRDKKKLKGNTPGESTPNTEERKSATGTKVSNPKPSQQTAKTSTKTAGCNKNTEDGANDPDVEPKTPVAEDSKVGRSENGFVFGGGKTDRIESAAAASTSASIGLFDSVDKKKEGSHLPGSGKDSPSQPSSVEALPPSGSSSGSSGRTTKSTSNTATAKQTKKGSQTGTASQGGQRSRSSSRNRKGSDQASQDKQSSQTGKSKATKTGHGSGSIESKDTFDVQFHVFVSQDFKFNKQTDKVVIRFRPGLLGGFEKHEDKWIMTSKGTVGNGMEEMYLSVPFPKQLLKSTVFYKYIVVKKGAKYKWENYSRKYSSGIQDRSMYFPTDWNGKNDWQQYDGVVYKETKVSPFHSAIIFLFDTDNKRMAEHAELFFKHFMPQWFRPFGDSWPESPVHEALGTLDALIRGLRKVYFSDAGCWFLEKDFKIQVGKAIFEDAIRMVGNLNGEKMDAKNRLRVMISALAIISAAQKLTMDCLKEKDRQILCRALLVHVDAENKTFSELQTIRDYFPDNRKLTEDLTSFCKHIADSSKDPSWLFAMPLVHFLYQKCKPFEAPKQDVSHDHYIPTWWGITDIGQSTVHSFKNKTSGWKIPLQDVIGSLHPLFEMDYLLPRTIMASLNLQEVFEAIQTAVFPVEVSVATTLYHFKNDYYSFEQGTHMKCVTAVLEQMQTFFVPEELNEGILNHWWMSYKISAELVDASANYAFAGQMWHSVQLFLHSVAIFEHIQRSLHPKQPSTRQNSDYLKTTDERISKVTWWVRKYSHSFRQQMDFILEVQNELLATEQLQSISIRDAWNEKMMHDFQSLLTTKLSGQTDIVSDFVQLYCRKVDNFKQCMQDVLSRTAFKVIEKGYALDYGTLKPHEKARFARLLSRLFQDEWQKAMAKPNSSQDATVISHVVNWQPFSHYLRISYKEGDKTELLTDECRLNIALAVTVVEKVLVDLMSGQITVGMYHEIRNSVDKFSELVQEIFLVDVEGTRMKEEVQKVMEIRKKELECYHIQHEYVTTLVNLFHFVPEGLRLLHDLDDAMDERRNLVAIPFTSLCKPSTGRDIANIDNYTPEINAFPISPETQHILKPLHDCNRSSVFHKMWESTCRQKGQECSDLDSVIRHVCSPTFQHWRTIGQHIRSGTILFRDMEKWIGNTYKDNLEGMQKELACLGVSVSEANERLQQLKKYRVLGKCVKEADVILEFAHQYGLKGDFGPIQQLASRHGGLEFQMKNFDESLMKTCDFLKEITEERAGCLMSFVNCNSLVAWLKESMKKGGLKELKVFVDLAYISAGDEPLEIARVQCLHSAVTGYAPLIFELDQSAGYKDLLQLCRIVWKELDANTKLPELLRDTNRQLEWLKAIQKAHGSVEVTSLEQSKSINAAGVYCVGLVPGMGQEEELRMNVLSVLRLTVPEDREGKRHTRHYTYSQLQDLQSRLMLVAGKAEKGGDDVGRFTTVFDSVTRLANVYIKLCSAGCVLFKNWQAKFLCDPKRTVCAFLEFGQGAKQLKGRQSGSTVDLTLIVPRIAKFMEQCLERWLEYINTQRKEYLHLNYFTIDQLVFLQRELVKVGTDQIPSVLIYPLLSAVKESCTQGDLIEAMQKAEKDIALKEDETMKDKESAAAPTPVDNEQEERELKVKTFISEMEEAGYPEPIARKALEHLDPDQVAEGIIRCLDISEEMEEDVPPGGDVNMAETPGNATHAADSSLAGYGGWSKSENSIQSVASAIVASLKGADCEIQLEELIADLETLWGKFLSSVSSSLTDYLSLDHLGHILRRLSEKSESTIQRRLLPIFQKGVPNLIICPTDDILNTVLTIYSNDVEQPLPSADEVLVCTNTTTLDQLDIFWRRALFDSRGKIHCLVSADLLDFEVSDKGEGLLDEYMQELQHQDPDYKLVVLCGSDNEYRSRIISALDKYRKPAIPLNATHIKKYVLKKLMVTEPIDGCPSAASLDFEKSSVRLVKSHRAGVGKTLYKRRRDDDLKRLGAKQKTESVSVPLQRKVVDVPCVAEILISHTQTPGTAIARIFHIDVSHEAQDGVDVLLFNMLILGRVMDKAGHVWLKSPRDLYLIENMLLQTKSMVQKREYLKSIHPIMDILPAMTCRSPQESLNILTKVHVPQDIRDEDQLFDLQQFRSEMFQRPFQYLDRLDMGQNLAGIDPYTTARTPEVCLRTLLRHCGVPDPSWAELHHFVWFLNTQLRDFELSNFTGQAAAEDLPGFNKFTLRFLIQMSRDFSTWSLVMSEESPESAVKVEAMRIDEGDNDDNTDDNDLEQFQMRRTWESSPHPYLFFNPDHHSITFLGFNIDRGSGNLRDQQTGQILEERIMERNLYDALVRNLVPIQENFDALPRSDKIQKLCNVMGMDMPYDPDDTYELTTDNVKKIMAIYMRFRCNIPVIIMGETGCGKTRLVKFMCALQTQPGVKMTNMLLMKVHGGTTNVDIIREVKKAEKIAEENTRQFPHMFTVLFFDEANTTESIGLIKEIMCDRTVNGKPLKLPENLKMVAACNPYRKHSEDLIKKLEQAGLGYHVDADKTTDRLGRVPMRRLVYRVQPLPQSLLPLVWDFGQLNTQVEDLYIRQMVRRYIRDGKLPDRPGLVEVVSAILTASQEYMRDQRDECSFVSLRDVDRVLSVMSWFWEQSQHDRTLFQKMDDSFEEYDNPENEKDIGDEEEEEEEQDDELVHEDNELDDVTRSLVLALGVCYHACLKTREEYRQHVSGFFRSPCSLPGGPDQINDAIICCQDIFLDQVHLEKNIARNMALKENLFMMVVCVELRIPLFLVGKPGSSKSLAKTIVSDAMQGNAAHTDLFKELKQVQMVSFQCSPLSTPDGIVGTFRQCSQFQRDKDLGRFVSVVVLDEVGLAEDSPRMPLKTLHPLLEDGCQGDETPEPYKKVAFIGISNWALDPAKMNRGILVQREVPDIEELKSSAEGICTGKPEKTWIQPHIGPLAKSYLDLFHNASDNLREFFGLRDFYSLIKMVYSFVEKHKGPPTWHQLLHSIRRNFGGLDDIDPVDSFRENLIMVNDKKPKQRDPDCSPAGLIRACLFDTNETQSESRYLLLLTESYGVLPILQQQILAMQNVVTIFGSSFPSDQEYTQVCRNINRIKVCMETGNTVVLLNLENLYESLYDALNQYYVYFGGERYVDLGLGTHRVKCRVHKSFKLIVVAVKQVVYKKFPIPLINRLEKHFLTVDTMLTDNQRQLAQKLQKWAKDFSEERHRLGNKPTNSVGDVFMGYHPDTCPAVVLQIWQSLEKAKAEITPDKIMMEAKKTLLWCATPDAVVRLPNSNLPPKEQKQLKQLYMSEQTHDSLSSYLQYKLQTGEGQLLAQVTTHSKLLSTVDKAGISAATKVNTDCIMLETLQSFDTEQQFTRNIRDHFDMEQEQERLLLIQCDSGDTNGNLVACARHCVLDINNEVLDRLRAPFHVVFIIQLPRIVGGCFTGFQCGVWHSVHIDDLRTSGDDIPSIQEMQDQSVAELFCGGVRSAMAMETDDIGILQQQQVDMERNDEAMETEDTERTSPTNMGRQETSIEMEDLILQLQQEPNQSEERQQDEREPEHSQLNVRGLIVACVQPALAMIKDKDNNSARTTDRVELLLRLLHEDTEEDGPSFFQGLSGQIATLLKEKEDTVFSPERAAQWMPNEAAQSSRISKAGTFRRACIQVLESKLSPVLAALIAHVDTNRNLDIISLTRSCEWKRALWLQVLNTVGALQLEYSDLQSPTRQEELTDVMVKETGCEGHPFSSEMPFSWLVYQRIEELMQITVPAEEHETTSGGDDSNDRLISVLSEEPLGKILFQITNADHADEIVHCYLEDFMHFVYHARSTSEHTLVCQTVSYLARSKALERGTDGLLQKLVCLHEAHKELGPRLVYFSDMNKVWKGCSDAIMEVKEKTPDHFMFNETEFTFSALGLLIESLAPTNQTQLDDPRGRSKWLSRVHTCRPVVEKVLRLHGEDPEVFGVHSAGSVNRARFLWNKVVVMKLFLEHVCTASEKDEKITIKNCMPLWKLLGDQTDMKEIESLSKVERFLKICNKSAMTTYFGKQGKCHNCETSLEGPPVELVCNHVICNNCFTELMAENRKRCPCVNCNAVIAEKHRPQMNENQRLFKNYQKRCNSFFMDMVSQLCFADNLPPSDEVIDRLLGYITFQLQGSKTLRTKELTVFEYCLDPNPVFRSFLLQLLLRTSEEKVEENLEKYLEKAKVLLEQGGNVNRDEDFIQLSLLVVQCLEDLFLEESLKEGNEVVMARQCLHQARSGLRTEYLDVEKLYGLAKARFGLVVAAKQIYQIVSNASNTVSADVRRLIDEAEILCMESDCRWPKIFLVKCLCRSYGQNTYHAICQRRDVRYLRWIPLPEIEQKVEGPDRYVTCGEEYRRLREAVTQVALGEDVQQLTNEIETRGQNREGLLCLALHREVTCSYLYPLQKRRIREQTLQSLSEYFQKQDNVRNKNIVQSCIQNTFGSQCPYLTVGEGQDLRTQGIQCLLVHFFCSMMDIETDGTLLQPIRGLITQPAAYQNAFLPTMPHDDLQEVKEALLAARTTVRGADTNPVFYRCPNGHPYVIGDCGRPYVLAKCRCGQEIGGAGHVPHTGNIQDQGQDLTETGHILGRANRRGASIAERTMSRECCCCVRLMTHMAMLLGATSNPQAFVAIIKPALEVGGVCKFLWDHILQDVAELHRVLGRSEDDVLLLMHIVLQHMGAHNNKGVNNEARMWSSKEGRKTWEDTFSRRVLAHVLQNGDGLLTNANKAVIEDTRLGSNPLLCLLYEIDTPNVHVQPADIQESPCLWRYRSSISVEHLQHELSVHLANKGGRKQHAMLQLFLEEERMLRAIRFIPSILKLHRILIQRYQRKLDRAEATTVYISKVHRDHKDGEEIKSLIQDFADAWELVREALVVYACPTEIGNVVVPKEYCRQKVDQGTPISMILPTNREEGLCSFVMLDYLLRKQNDVLDRYCKASKRKPESFSSVRVQEVTEAHLISFDRDKDLLPMILANCQYSFEIGKGTMIEYDYANLERQLMDRLLYSKSRIEIKGIIEIDRMVYRSEYTNAMVFRKLQNKIPQESLGSAVKHQVAEDFKNLPDLCRSLDNLDITISFLKSVGGDPSRSLEEFMVSTLKIETPLHSQKARQACQFRHTQSLWILLSLLKTKKMAVYGTRYNVFDGLREDLHASLDETQNDELQDYLGKLSIDKLDCLLEVMYETMVLVISVSQNPDDEDYIDNGNLSLRDCVMVHAEEMEPQILDVQILVEFPKSLLCKHRVHTWLMVHNVHHNKITGKRRY